MRLILICGLLTLSAAALAQPAQPPFEPYTVTEQQHNSIVEYLLNLPARHANPLLNTITQMEREAQQKKAAEAKTPTKAE